MRRRNRTLIQIETWFIWTYFCGERILSRKCPKSSIFVNSVSWSCIQYNFISRGAAFLMRDGYLKQGSNNILKQFLYFFTKNFWGKVDINFKSLNKINLLFKQKFGYFGLHLEIYITDQNFLFHTSKMYSIINLSALCSLKAWYPKMFYGLSDFQCANTAFL